MTDIPDRAQFTAVITTVSPAPVSSSSPLFRLLRNLAASTSLAGITVLWRHSVAAPPSRDWSVIGGVSRQRPDTGLGVATVV